MLFLINLLSSTKLFYTDSMTNINLSKGYLLDMAYFLGPVPGFGDILPKQTKIYVATALTSNAGKAGRMWEGIHNLPRVKCRWEIRPEKGWGIALDRERYFS